MPEDFTVQIATDMFEQPHSTERITWPSPQKKRPPQDVVDYLCERLEADTAELRSALNAAPRNVRTVLRRHITSITIRNENRPVCRFHGEQHLFRALIPLERQLALLTLARVWDEGHIRLCKTTSAKRDGKPYNAEFLRNPCIDLRSLVDDIEDDQDSVNGKIKLVQTNDGLMPLRAAWELCSRMTFDELPRLDSLADTLPGEVSQNSEYAGIGGGGGSDVISASLLGRLLELHKKRMNLLVSTRTWATGSQGKEGDVIGIKRQVYNHAGPAQYQGKPVAGTFRIGPNTYAEGRDLETIPLRYHKEIYMVLDQGESTKDIPENERVNLEDQFNAVLTESDKTLVVVNTGGNVVLSVDTGGDVFGTDGTGGTTPDQDLRVQKALSGLPLVKSSTGAPQPRSLVTAVVAPGVDAPNDAPLKAKLAGGKVYKPNAKEREMFLDTLAEYEMDGNNPKRFGKTTLALQECLRGKEGWTSLNLPEHVVNTWENPWSSFVYIQKCMSDIIFMPTKALLPLISPNYNQENGS